MARIVRGHGPGTAVGQVVAGDAGDHGVARAASAPPPRATRSGSSGDERQRVAGVDLAEAARPRAALAVDHERRGAVGPALVDVRAARLLAHRDEAEVVDRSPRAGGSPCRCARAPAPTPACAARCRGRPRVPRRPGAGAAAAGARRLAVALTAPAARARVTTSWRSTSRRRSSGGPCATKASTTVVHRRRRGPRPPATSRPRSAIPHGTMWPNIARSVVTLRATPCSVRRRPGPTRMVRTPMAAILRGVGPLRVDPDAGVLVRRCVQPGRPRSASVVDHDLLEPVHVRRTRRRVVGHGDDRVATSWPGPWYVTSPPRSVRSSAAPTCAGSTRTWRSSACAPSV